MKETGMAYFVQHPRIVNDLIILHDVMDEKPYEIVKEIRLQAIDFENFITDMTVDRQYIEDYASLCDDGEIKKCLLIRSRDPEYGILVLPEARSYVGWAAYIRE